MKFSAIIRLCSIAILLSFMVNTNSFADTSNITNSESCAKTLQTLGILKGYSDGSLKLDNNITRSEFITLMVRMMGYDKNTSISSIPSSFIDIQKTHWAYNYIIIALKHSLINGYSDKTIRPDNNVTNAETLKVILNITGYGNSLTGSWPDNVISKAKELGISKNTLLTPDKIISRGEMCLILYNSLIVDFKD